MANWRMHFLIAGLLCALCTPSLASAKWATYRSIQAAREAISLGLMDKWKQALDRGEKQFARESPKMPLSQRQNARMWLHLLWAKYYQYKGVLPPIRDVGSFESQKALQQYLQQVDRAVALLAKALAHFRGYNRLYSQLMDRTKLQSQVYLQASLSMARDVAARQRSGKIYLAFLRYVDANWGSQKKIQKKVSQNQLAISRLRVLQGKTSKRQEALRDGQKKLAASIQNAHVLYTRLQNQMSSAYVSSTVLLIIGAVVIAGALGVGAFGFLQHQDVEQRIQCHRDKAPGCETLLTSKDEAELRQGPVLLWGVAAGGVALGLVSIIVGIVIRPARGAASKASMRSHQKYLDHEKNKKSGGLSRLPTPPVPPAAFVLGRW